MGTLTGGMEFAAGKPVRLTAPPETVPALPIRLDLHERPEVQAGQTVRQGQVVAYAGRLQRGSQISPMEGVVRQLLPPAPGTPGGRYRLLIEPTSKTTTTTLPIVPPKGRKLDHWFESLRHTGPWSEADGGVGFFAQLEAAQQNPPDTVVCAGLDAFPPFPDASSLLMSFPDDAVMGTLILADLVGAPHAKLVVGRSAAVVGRLRPSCRNYRLRLEAVTNVYPAADPTLLVYEHAPQRRGLRHGENPVAQGVLIVTPWTAIRVARWFTLRRLDLLRPVMIAWPEPGAELSWAWTFGGQPLGSLHERLAEQMSDLLPRMLWGDPMTGRPVTGQKDREGTSGEQAGFEPVVSLEHALLTVMPALGRPEPLPCIACGWCVDVCPTELRPAHLLHLCQTRPLDDDLAEQLDWCIDCGLCSHVCPVSLPLAQTFRHQVALLAQHGKAEEVA